MVESVSVRSSPSGSLSGADDRLREPEGRRRQDHDGGQSGEPISRSPATASSSSISIPRATPRAASGSTERPLERSIYDGLVDGVACAELIVRRTSTGVDLVPVRDRAGRRRGRARRVDRRGSAPAARSLGAAGRRLRRHLHRLPAVARAAHRQCADRRRCGPHPDPMRVLRPGGSDPVARHDRPRPRPPEPAPRHQGRRADDVRRPDEPVRGRRGRGAPPSRRRVYETVIPRSVRLSEAPSHGLPIARYAPDSRGGRRLRRAGRGVPRAHGTRRRDRTPHPVESDARESPMVACHDRSTRARPGPRPRPRRADPAAQRRPAGPDRDPARADPAEPAPAAPAVRRRPSWRRSPRASASTACSSRSSSPRRSTATSSSPASAASGRPQLAGLERIPAVVRQLADRDAARARPRREPPARGPRPDRGGARLPPADRRVRVHPGGDRRRASAGPGRRSRTRCASSTCDRGVQAASPTARSPRATRRALGGLPVEHQEHVLGTVIDQELSVRQTEELVRRLREPTRADAVAASDAAPTAIPTSSASRRTCAARSAPRSASPARGKGGRIVIEYYSDEELGRLYDRLTGGTA